MIIILNPYTQNLFSFLFAVCVRKDEDHLVNTLQLWDVIMMIIIFEYALQKEKVTD